MANGCHQMYDVTEVTDVNDFPYQENGKSFLIRFNGMNKDPA